MAVKQKVIECVEQSKEARLQIILRALQSISEQDGLQDKICIQIVKSLGTVPIPSDAVSYMKFIEDIKKVQDILAKECYHKKHTFIALKAMYDEISNPDPSRQPSPAMSIVLQLIDVRSIPNAVKYILNTGYPEQNLERAIRTLCNWLKKCAWAENLGPLVLAFMQGLEADHHYDILVDVTLTEIEHLFRLVMFPKIRQAVGPIVLYMLSRNQHNPQVFHKVVPLAAGVYEALQKERSPSSMRFLGDIVNLFVALMDHFPGYPDLYQPLTELLQPHLHEGAAAVDDAQAPLRCRSWEGAAGGSSSGGRSRDDKVGLSNLGNTCYMNSVLQALFMTKAFRNEVLQREIGRSPLFDRLQELFALLQFSSRKFLAPTDVLREAKPRNFEQGQQHDSSEFLGILLEHLHEEERKYGGARRGALPEQMHPEGGEDRAATLTRRLFHGKTLNISTCGECGYNNEMEAPFWLISLGLPDNSDFNTVKDLLNHYLDLEQLTGNNRYHCSRCDRLTDGERICSLRVTPPRLIFSLKLTRYDQMTGEGCKLETSVYLNERITVGGEFYLLYAVIVHDGVNAATGHYYAFIKDEEDWFKFNDEEVSKSSFDDPSLLSYPATPSILFYELEGANQKERDLGLRELCERLQDVVHLDNRLFEEQLRRDDLTNTRNFVDVADPNSNNVVQDSSHVSLASNLNLDNYTDWNLNQVWLDLPLSHQEGLTNANSSKWNNVVQDSSQYYNNVDLNNARNSADANSFLLKDGIQESVNEPPPPDFINEDDLFPFGAIFTDHTF